MIFVFSAPSGSGKSTLINFLMSKVEGLWFSISATSRLPRGTEQDGVEYFFLTPDQFRAKIAEGAFIEYEEVYPDKFYGTLKSEVDRHLKAGENVVMDIDVKGAVNVKKLYGDGALLIFIKPPSVEELRRRLEKRQTDKPEVIEQRVSKAAEEITYAEQFDQVVVNDELERAQQEVLDIVSSHLKG